MTFAEGRLEPDELRAMPLHERIYRIRTSLELSQAEVADAVGVNVKTVNRWENDDAEPQRQSRAALAKATGYPESLFKRKARTPTESPDLLTEIKTTLDEFQIAIARQLKDQSALLATLTAVAAELRKRVGLPEASATAPRPSRKRRPA